MNLCRAEPRTVATYTSALSARAHPVLHFGDGGCVRLPAPIVRPVPLDTGLGKQRKGYTRIPADWRAKGSCCQTLSTQTKLKTQNTCYGLSSYLLAPVEIRSCTMELPRFGAEELPHFGFQPRKETGARNKRKQVSRKQAHLDRTKRAPVSGESRGTPVKTGPTGNGGTTKNKGIHESISRIPEAQSAAESFWAVF